jgi:hypothetical protein
VSVRAAVFLAAAVIAAGCSSRAASPSEAPKISEDPPPSPASWPRYPRFSDHSCWSRPPVGLGVMRFAPSFALRRSGRPTPPDEIVRRLLARFGDRSFVRRIELGSPPPLTLMHLKGWYGGRRPPRDALWAYIAAPAAVTPRDPTSRQLREWSIADWEVQLVRGALRDEFCAFGGRPLVGWSVSSVDRGVGDPTFALGQRFPNPKPRAFRARVAAVGRRYGFEVVSLRLLRPLDYAPLLVVSTDRDRKEFVHDVPEIMRLLNPTSPGVRNTAITFEGFFLEARDGRGPFVRVESVERGEAMGGQWSWDRCVYPYPHSEAVSAPPCPAE